MGSIREVGWTVPILVDEANVVIAGHGRVLAAERFGISGRIAAAMADQLGRGQEELWWYTCN